MFLSCRSRVNSLHSTRYIMDKLHKLQHWVLITRLNLDRENLAKHQHHNNIVNLQQHTDSLRCWCDICKQGQQSLADHLRRPGHQPSLAIHLRRPSHQPRLHIHPRRPCQQLVACRTPHPPRQGQHLASCMPLHRPRSPCRCHGPLPRRLCRRTRLVGASDMARRPGRTHP